MKKKIFISVVSVVAVAAVIVAIILVNCSGNTSKSTAEVNGTTASTVVNS